MFAAVMRALAELSQDLPVVFPVHPRTRARLPEGLGAAPGLRLVDPIGYVDFLALETWAAGVLTDSGGVQEETTFLRVPCFTLRENTERPVTLTHGTNRLLGLRPEAIGSIRAGLNTPRLALAPPAGWDGHAARRVADTLVPWLSADLPLSETDEVGDARAAATR
jgi:UDP-N-acetylglucosamine 2-epimerase (non-hydrolysing)